ncbi:MAG: malectin domain-containing carbohydrate-binding protein, partial [Capsulimonadaceae bacterium]
MISGRILRRHISSLLAIAALVCGVSAARAQTVTMTIVNDCNTTIYPGVTAYLTTQQNYTLTPNTSVVVTVPSDWSAARIWGRKNCITTTSPWTCDSDQGDTTLTEFTLSGLTGGVDWFDISDVDAYSFPVTLANTMGANITAVGDVLQACPSVLQVIGAESGNVVSCENPCGYYNNSLVCQSILSPQNSRDVVSDWPATAQQYVNLIHNYEGETYSYPYDDWWGLHTTPTGGNWTITFCPNGLNPVPGNNPDLFPLAPTNLTGTSSGTTATLTWNAVAGATSYNVYRTITEGSSTANPQDTPQANVTTNSFSDTGLTTGTTYYYIVTALNSAGFSVPTSELWLTAGAGAGSTIPSPMGVVTGTSASGQVTLSWSAVSGATSYDIYPALTPGTEALNGLTATPGNGENALCWTALSGATSYNVYRGNTSGGEVQLATGQTNLYYMDGGLANGSTYYYEIAPVNSAGSVGTKSNEAASAPVAGAPAPILHSNPWEYTTTTNSDTITGLPNGETFYFIVLPANAVGQGAGSTEMNATPSTTTYPNGDIPINCGGTAVTPWIADTDFNGGTESASGNPISFGGVTNPAPGGVYQTNRYGTFTYTISGLTVGASYTTRLHFCETFHTGAGQREFNVFINGTQVLTDFDIYATAGGQNVACVEPFTATANSNGAIVVTFGAVVDNPQINGIEVYPTTAIAPAAPTNLVATGGSSQVSLTWNASGGATSYSLYRGTSSGGESGTALATLTSTTYLDTTVSNAVTYYYYVTATDGNGTSGHSNESYATPQGTAPAAPLGLSASPNNQQITLVWFASGTATSYNIYRGTTSGGESATAIATGITAATYLNTGLTNGTTYYYKVSALNAYGSSGLSTEAYATANGQPPAAPSGLTSVSGNAQVTLSWTSDATATSYSVYRGTTSGGESATAIGSGITVLTYTDTTVTNGTTYYYKITALNTFGTSPQSSEVTGIPEPPFTGLQIACGSTAAISPYIADTDYSGGTTDSWTTTVNTTLLTSPVPPAALLLQDREGTFTYTINGVSSGQSYPVTMYFVEQYWGAAGDRVFSVTCNGTTVINNLDIYATAGADYKAIQETFTGVGSSTGQLVFTFTPSVDAAKCSGISIGTASGTAPATPTGLTATGSSGQVALTWSASSGATAYNLFRSTTSGGEGTTAYKAGLTTTSYTDTGLTNGTAYYYTVNAVNSYGSSAQSTQASATPSASVPAAPTGLTATPGNAQIALSWTASSGATSYNVYRGTAT